MSQECSSSAFPWGVDLLPKSISVFTIRRGRRGRRPSRTRAFWQCVSKHVRFLVGISQIPGVTSSEFAHFVEVKSIRHRPFALTSHTAFNLFSFWMILIFWFLGTCRPCRHISLQKTHVCCINTCTGNVNARHSWGWPDPDPTCPTHHKDTHTHTVYAFT